MAVETKVQLKTYFESGDQPTQGQFENLIDSLRHEDEPINGFTNLVGTNTHIFPAGGTFILAQGELIIHMVVVADALGTVKVEIVGETVFIDEAMGSGEYEIISDPVYAVVQKTITITGIATVNVVVAKF